MGCLYYLRARKSHTHEHMAMEPEKRGRNIDLRWDPGVDHEFDAAECTLDWCLRFNNRESRERELQVDRKADNF